LVSQGQHNDPLLSTLRKSQSIKGSEELEESEQAAMFLTV